MTLNPSEAGAEEEAAPEEATADLSPLAELANTIANSVGGRAEVNFETAKVRVDSANWATSLTAARDEFGLLFFSWLSAIDWTNDVAQGEKLSAEVEERYEVMAAVSDLDEGNLVIFSTDIGKDQPRVSSLVDVYAGANWHEREASEMFGIDFSGHPQLQKLYLPDGFVGHPLRKSFPLLSRQVKPWPGKVDVEGMPGQGDDEPSPDEPSTENPEA
ncbi:MAG: NADH-quinone oxidoreductase subunit C [Acidimicrobiia bacterium]